METTTQTIACPTLHMRGHIWTLFQMFATYPIEVPKDTFISTHPYCNCREQGFVITVRQGSTNTNYAFYEHRNSDQICVVQWQGVTNITGAVTPDDIPAEVMKDKWDVTQSFDCREYDTVLRWFTTELEKSFGIE